VIAVVDHGELAIAIADTVVTGFDRCVLDRNVATREAERVLLARIDMDRETGHQHAPLRARPPGFAFIATVRVCQKIIERRAPR